MSKIIYSILLLSLLACGTENPNIVDNRTNEENLVDSTKPGFAIAALPNKVGIFGDSIGVGLFSDTSLGERITSNSHPDLIDMFNVLLANLFFDPSTAITNFLDGLTVHYKELQI